MKTWIPAILQIGPLTLATERIALLCGVLLGLLVVRVVMTRGGSDGKSIANALAESLLLGSFATILAPLVLHPQDVFTHPLTALLSGVLPGAAWGGFLIFTFASAWKLRKIRFAKWTFIDAIAGGFYSGWAVYSLVVEDYGTKSKLMSGVFSTTWYHPLHLYRALMLALLCTLAFRTMRRARPGKGGALLLVGSGWMQLLLSMLANAAPLLLHLTRNQWLGLLCAMLGSRCLVASREPADDGVRDG